MVFFLLFLLAGELCQLVAQGICPSYHAGYRMRISGWRLPWGWGWIKNLITLFTCNTGFTRALPLPGPWGGVIKTGGGAPILYGTVENAGFCGFFSTLLLCDLHKLLEKWKELNVMTFGSAFPAWCRYFLPDSSKLVIHGIGCTFCSGLSLKNQWWQTRSLAFPQARGLGAGEYQHTSPAPSHTL